MMPPASVIVVILRRCISEYGASRTTRTSLRRSLSITSAARSISDCDTPEAMRPTLPIDAGTTIMASQRAEPLATDDHMSSFEYRSTRSCSGSVTPSCAITPSALLLQMRAMRSTLLFASSSSRHSRAYIAPLAPVIATIIFMVTTLRFCTPDPSREPCVVAAEGRSWCF